ncbi:cation transporter [Megasphaera paucivorans]|nr:cation transporter [Megasphaera paucivorans]
MMNMGAKRSEKRLLILSAAMMGLVAVGGTVTGILSNSQAILLDGIFSFVAIIIKVLMMVTSELTRHESSKRFQFGYWQCEPVVMFLEGTFTLLVVVYAFYAGVAGLLDGGHSMSFGIATYYAAFFALLDWLFYFYVRSSNKKIQSYLVHYDNVSWFVDATLASGLLLSFGFAWFMQYTRFAYLDIYVDSLIMIVLAVQMIPPAMKILIPSVKQILGVAPIELHNHVQQVMDRFMERYGFSDYVSSVQAYGRAKIIEIDILLPRDYPIQNVSELDRIRTEIDHSIGYPSYEKWLTISFTTTKTWMAKDYELGEAG